MKTLTEFRPIGLAELNRDAAFQTRVDTKYLVSADTAAEVIAALPPGTRVLQIGPETRFTYQSVYFDTPDLVTYHQSAHKRRRRFKVRTRHYVESGMVFLEVKTRGFRGVTEKTRIPYDWENFRELTPEGLDFIRLALLNAGLDQGPVDSLSPYLGTGYTRQTFLIPATQSAPPVRMTVDTNLSWEQLADNTALPGALFRGDLAAIETKSSVRNNQVNHFLWSRGIRPDVLSKYCAGAAALDPRLPANKWHRSVQTLTEGTS